jgi:hypothetical protein
MQSIHYSSEHYTDRGHYAVMTRTTILKDAQLTSVEDLVSSSNPPAIHDCRLAGGMLGVTFSLVPVRIGSKLDH